MSPVGAAGNSAGSIGTRTIPAGHPDVVATATSVVPVGGAGRTGGVPSGGATAAATCNVAADGAGACEPLSRRHDNVPHASTTPRTVVTRGSLRMGRSYRVFCMTMTITSKFPAHLNNSSAWLGST